ncbi:MAG: hypothetical protein KGJ23_13385 [Euryarchaeota archaeon]|nr:hypothetical protein [Euryarchaeota archaeon]MDE1837592.1 hypothetical protein [Euryarchaeota archaeon]MDE1881245.1 hypothetical protein [Euryarchaeota archaeon]MDE2045903.1 hypothetical protein [Thermoplasmata archaeon]
MGLAQRSTTADPPPDQEPSGEAPGPEEKGTEVPVHIVHEVQSATPRRRAEGSTTTPRAGRSGLGEPLAILMGKTDGVEWKVGVVVQDGAFLPIFEFSAKVPREHPAVLEAYVGLVRCLQSAIGEAWSAKSMCPVCHLPSSAPQECDCCEQRMCGVCRARHARGQGIPGTGEPRAQTRSDPVPPKDGRYPQTLPGYG